MRLHEFCKCCKVAVILFYFTLPQSDKILAQFLCKSFVLFCFIPNGRTALAALIREFLTSMTKKLSVTGYRALVGAQLII